jgi:hypothetical protein
MQKNPETSKLGKMIEKLDDETGKKVIEQAYEINRKGGDSKEINVVIREVLMGMIKAGAITEESVSWWNERDIPWYKGGIYDF